jgi:hypothetical protein
MQNDKNETLYPFAPAALKCSNKCMVLLNPHYIELKSNVVTEIKIQNVYGFCYNYVIEVQHHLDHTKWRVCNDYLYYDNKTNSISVSLITPYYKTLARNESLCHIRFEPLWKICKELEFDIYCNT